MKKILLNAATAILTLSIFSADAALPPFYQSLREYKTLINSEELTKKLDSADLIMDISRNDNTFTVTTLKHKLVVDIVYEPFTQPGFVGPAQYHLQFHDPEAI